MATTLDTTSVETAARQLLDSRIQAVHTLAQARQNRDAKRVELAEAERADTAAQRAGWTPDELRKVGLDAPARRSPDRPRTNRSSNSATQDT